jgi:hypothetical protein
MLSRSQRCHWVGLLPQDRPQGLTQDVLKSRLHRQAHQGLELLKNDPARGPKYTPPALSGKCNVTHVHPPGIGLLDPHELPLGLLQGYQEIGT